MFITKKRIFEQRLEEENTYFTYDICFSNIYELQNN